MGNEGRLGVESAGTGGFPPSSDPLPGVLQAQRGASSNPNPNPDPNPDPNPNPNPNPNSNTNPNPNPNPHQAQRGAAFGLTKALGLEWHHVFCRGIDLAESLAAPAAAAAVVREITCADLTLREVG